MRAGGARPIAKELQLALSSQSRRLYFHGESMCPFLVEGDEVVVTWVAWEDIRPGDVITYRFGEKFPTRRVVRRSHNGLHLWCENWRDRQFYAAREDVLGRAVARKRGDRWITSGDREWAAARRAALAAYWRRFAVPVSVDAARRAAAKLLRVTGLRRPSPARHGEEP